MLDKNISRFCELVAEINKKNEELDNRRGGFYYGGHSFEDTYQEDIVELSNLQQELKEILINIKL